MVFIVRTVAAGRKNGELEIHWPRWNEVGFGDLVRRVGLGGEVWIDSESENEGEVTVNQLNRTWKRCMFEQLCHPFILHCPIALSITIYNTRQPTKYLHGDNFFSSSSHHVTIQSMHRHFDPKTPKTQKPSWLRYHIISYPNAMPKVSSPAWTPFINPKCKRQCRSRISNVSTFISPSYSFSSQAPTQTLSSPLD